MVSELSSKGCVPQSNNSMEFTPYQRISKGMISPYEMACQVLALKVYEYNTLIH